MKNVILPIVKNTGKINFWNMSIFKNCAITSRANANTYNKRPMIINAFVACNSPDCKHRNVSCILHSCKNLSKYTYATCNKCNINAVTCSFVHNISRNLKVLLLE